MEMLTILDTLPAGLLEAEARDLQSLLPGPTLIHLPGRRPAPVFASVLLHGNETSGWDALRLLLRKYGDRELPRAFSFFIGNVDAARLGRRRLDGQIDYNRIWGDESAGAPYDAGAKDGGAGGAERAMARRILAEMKSRGVFASVDLHNNTGPNPRYACINSLDQAFLHLAVMFGRTIVYFLHPKGVQSLAFAELCPAVTLECGQPGDPEGIRRARDFLDACLHLAEFPAHPVPPGDYDLFHTVAVVRVPPDRSFGFGEGDFDIHFPVGLEAFNFRELEPGTLLARLRTPLRLDVRDEAGRDVSGRFLDDENGEIRTRRMLMPSMLTRNEAIIRQDCLCYFMERIPRN